VTEGSAAPSQELSRSTLRSELLIVLALTFFASTAYALIRFAHDALNVPVTQPAIVTYQPPIFDVYSFLSEIVGYSVRVLPVMLVAHLLARAGSSMRELGFDTTRLRRDALIGAGLAVLALAASIGAAAAARGVGLPFRPILPVNADAHLSALFLFLLGSATAAIGEEVVVNAYLITRLEQLGWSSRSALLVSTAVRATYHLYQGLGGFVNNIVGGLVAGWLFQRSRRIMPIVIAHFLFDLIAYLGYLALHERLGFLTG
jgi:membrane protease YdiL (CAAX protease family)